MTFYHSVKKLPKKGGKPKKQSTIDTYDIAMNSLCEIVDLNNVRLKDIDKKFVDSFRTKILNSKLALTTASSYYQWFSSFLSLAVKKDYMDKNPCLAVDTISKEDSEINYILHEDIQKLIGAKCPCPVLYKAGIFASQTGMRSGDLMELRWKRITKIGDLYRIALKQEKTDKPYLVHFKQEVMDIIGPPGNPDDLVFPGFKNNNQTNSNILIWFAKAEVTPRAKPDENFTMHDFRHTFAITLGLNGANLYEISQMLGHKSVSTTEKHYARILEQMKRKIVLNLPAL
jgi:integrase